MMLDGRFSHFIHCGSPTASAKAWSNSRAGGVDVEGEREFVLPGLAEDVVALPAERGLANQLAGKEESQAEGRDVASSHVAGGKRSPERGNALGVGSGEPDAGSVCGGGHVLIHAINATGIDASKCDDLGGVNRAEGGWNNGGHRASSCTSVRCGRNPFA